jgi:hypothetical protein
MKKRTFDKRLRECWERIEYWSGVRHYATTPRLNQHCQKMERRWNAKMDKLNADHPDWNPYGI